MRQRQRFARYVVANRDDGQFQVNLVGGWRKVRSSLRNLPVCQNCLAKLAYDGFSFTLHGQAARRQRVAAFRLPEFFGQYPKDFITARPEHTTDTQPLNDYTSDWAIVSE